MHGILDFGVDLGWTLQMRLINIQELEYRVCVNWNKKSPHNSIYKLDNGFNTNLNLDVLNVNK
jgi:hypothetical protein